MYIFCWVGVVLVELGAGGSQLFPCQLSLSQPLTACSGAALGLSTLFFMISHVGSWCLLWWVFLGVLGGIIFLMLGVLWWD